MRAKELIERVVSGEHGYAKRVLVTAKAIADHVMKNYPSSDSLMAMVKSNLVSKDGELNSSKLEKMLSDAADAVSHDAVMNERAVNDLLDYIKKNI